jgi:hypothetical protein
MRSDGQSRTRSQSSHGSQQPMRPPRYPQPRDRNSAAARASVLGMAPVAVGDLVAEDELLVADDVAVGVPRCPSRARFSPTSCAATLERVRDVLLEIAGPEQGACTRPTRRFPANGLPPRTAPSQAGGPGCPWRRRYRHRRRLGLTPHAPVEMVPGRSALSVAVLALKR